MTLVATETRVRPTDPSFFANQDDAKFEMSLHLSSKNEAGAPREVGMHFLMSGHYEISPLP